MPGGAARHEWANTHQQTISCDLDDADSGATGTFLQLLSTLGAGLMVVSVFGRIMETFSFLSVFRLGFMGLFGAVALSVVSGKFTISDLFGLHESRLVFLYWLLGLVGCVFSVWPGGAFKAWMNLLLVNLVFYQVLNVNVNTQHDLRVLSFSILACAASLSLGTLYFSTRILVESGGITRYTMGETYDPNDLAMILVTIFPIALAHLLNGRILERLCALAVALISILTIVKTGSRGGMVGFAAVGMVFVVMHTPQISRFKKMAVVLVFMGVVSFLAPDYLWERFQTMFSGEDYNFDTEGEVLSTPGRLQIWAAGLQVFKDRFLPGVGIGQFGAATSQRMGRFFFVTAHNTFLQAAVELGIFGILVLVLLIAAIFANCRSAYRSFAMSNTTGFFLDLPKYVVLSMIGFLVCNMFLSRAYSKLVPILLAYSAGMAHIARLSLEKPADTAVSD